MSYQIVSRSGVVACLGGHHMKSKINKLRHEHKVSTRSIGLTLKNGAIVTYNKGLIIKAA